MKRALVLSLLVLGLGVFAFAGPLSGEWDTDICFDVDPGPTQTGAITVTKLTSLLLIDYEVCGWTFGTHVTFDYLVGLKDVGFTVAGGLGAFQFATDLDFNPQAVDLVLDGFTYWKGYVTIAIAGVDLYSGWMLKDQTGDLPFLSGFMLGGYGTVGDCTLYVEADFGMVPQLYYVYNYGLGYAYKYTFNVIGACDIAWTNLDIYAEFPFACLDVLVKTGFDCTTGFKGADFVFSHIDLGLSWLEIKSLTIGFEVDNKEVDLTFGLLTLDTVCITPYLSVIKGSQFQFEGISLDALAITYTWNGVTFIASELFANKEYYSVCSASIYPAGYGLGGNAANELIGFEIDGDSCCGGAFDAYVYNFFVFDPAGTEIPNGEIFNWDHTCVGLNYGISSTVTLSASLVVDKSGLNSMCFGFEFIW